MAMSNNQRVIPVKIRIQKQSSWTILICNLSWPIISLHHHSSAISLSSLFSPCTTKCHHTSSAIMIDPQLSANIIMHQKHNAPSCIIIYHQSLLCSTYAILIHNRHCVGKMLNPPCNRNSLETNAYYEFIGVVMFNVGIYVYAFETFWNNIQHR